MDVIDERSDEEEMKGRGITHTFACQKPKAFRYIRMHAAGVDWGCRNYLCLNSIEFYGYFLNK